MVLDKYAVLPDGRSKREHHRDVAEPPSEHQLFGPLNGAMAGEMADFEEFERNLQVQKQNDGQGQVGEYEYKHT